jgi:hypothetical protein
MKRKLREVILFTRGSFPLRGGFLLTIDPPIVIDSEDYGSLKDFRQAVENFRWKVAGAFEDLIDVDHAELEHDEETEK